MEHFSKMVYAQTMIVQEVWTHIIFISKAFEIVHKSSLIENINHVQRTKICVKYLNLQPAWQLSQFHSINLINRRSTIFYKHLTVLKILYSQSRIGSFNQSIKKMYWKKNNFIYVHTNKLKYLFERVNNFISCFGFRTLLNDEFLLNFNLIASHSSITSSLSSFFFKLEFVVLTKHKMYEWHTALGDEILAFYVYIFFIVYFHDDHYYD